MSSTINWIRTDGDSNGFHEFIDWVHCDAETWYQIPTNNQLLTIGRRRSSNNLQLHKTRHFESWSQYHVSVTHLVLTKGHHRALQLGDSAHLCWPSNHVTKKWNYQIVSCFLIPWSIDVTSFKSHSYKTVDIIHQVKSHHQHVFLEG